MLIGLRILILFSACVVSSLFAQDERIKPHKVMIVADDGYPPYSYVENQQLKGIYVEFIKKLSDKMAPRYQIELIGLPWKRALMKVKDGSALAVIPPYLHRDDRPYISHYSVPLLTETVVAYCHKNIDLESALSLKLTGEAINIGINSGYLILNQTYLKAKQNKRIVIWENRSTRANVVKLLTGRLDCYINDRRAIKQMLSSLIEADVNELVEMDIISSQTAHIGYSSSGQYPFKSEFIKEMNELILSEASVLLNDQ